MTVTVSAPLQPLLSDELIALRAPSQIWTAHDGEAGSQPAHGIYHGDIRHIRALRSFCESSTLETIACSSPSPWQQTFTVLIRGADDASPDPKLRLRRHREVSPGCVTERWTISSHVDHRVGLRLGVAAEPEFAPMHEVKAGLANTRGYRTVTSSSPEQADRIEAHCEGRYFVLHAPGAHVGEEEAGLQAAWDLSVEPFGEASLSFTVELHDNDLAVRAPARPMPQVTTLESECADPRVQRWCEAALQDLEALRLSLPEAPEDSFYAAGAPWFFTLFGRDALWTARLSVDVNPDMALATLRTLASLQGTVRDDETAQEPGKIIHELRSATLTIPGEGVRLPPLYYGSVDSTPLWVCLLGDVWRTGHHRDQMGGLVQPLTAALGWLLDYGDSDGDGFIDYIDRSGHGLANQGWKDSSDSIQWRSGRLAEGPIALAEVQGYAYEAARSAAEILEGLGITPEDARLAPAALREWAEELRERFARHFWVTTPEGSYPAVALDCHKQAVDTLTSNAGHLLGTGLLAPKQERGVADLLLGETMLSGYGVRTMSSEAAGYWPLSYHGGSVWMHDTAIVVHGMQRAGLHEQAVRVAKQMLDAAEGFAYRVPELHSGDPASEVSTPVPYPAACRPQAWSAAAAIVCANTLRLAPGRTRGSAAR